MSGPIYRRIFINSVSVFIVYENMQKWVIILRNIFIYDVI
jgi:hypothetical protein